MNTEIITPAQATEADLRHHAETINETIDLIVQHEDAFKEATLEPALLIGREIAKAQALFGMGNEDRARLGGEAKAALSRPVSKQEQPPNPLGFTAWLAREIPRLKRPTATKYATCFKALSLPDDTPDAAIRAKIKDLRHEAGKAGEPMPSLGTLYKAARPDKEQARLAMQNVQNPGNDPQQKLRDAREFWTVWREKGEALVGGGYLDALDKPAIADLREFSLWLRDRLNARLK